MTDTADFFRARLDQMIDPCHPLLVLESHMPRQEIETALAHRFERQARRGKKLKGLDLLGSTTTVVGVGASNARRPRLSLQLVASLLHLKHAFNESDQDVCHRWGETPVVEYLRRDHRVDRCHLKGQFDDAIHVGIGVGLLSWQRIAYIAPVQ